MIASSTSESGGRFGHQGRLVHPLGHVQGLAHHTPQLMQVERLEQVVVGAQPHGFDGRVGPLGHGHEDHRNPRVDLPQLLEDFQARIVGQPHVEQDHVGGAVANPLDAFGPGDRDFDHVRRRGKGLQHLPRDQGRVIIDE